MGEPNTPSQSGSPPRGIAAFDLGGVVPTAAAEPSAAPSTPPRAAQPTASPFAHGTFDASLFASDLAAFRPLCPVAYVPGGLVVEDALCRPGEMDGIVDWSSKEALVESSTVLDSAAPNLTATLRSFAFDLRAPSEGAAAAPSHLLDILPNPNHDFHLDGCIRAKRDALKELGVRSLGHRLKLVATLLGAD